MALAGIGLTACGGSDKESASPGTSTGAPAGEPVKGGVLKVTQVSEPRSLDPATMSNNGSSSALLGNAIYGNLLNWDFEAHAPLTDGTFAESFESTDGGTNFVLKLRSGVTFSDGKPFDAAAVKANWDRIKDPATGSADIMSAMVIKTLTVTDPQTLAIELQTPIPSFGSVIATSTLTWISEPTTLTKGSVVMDASPVGAGPFTLTSWARGNKFVFAANDSFFDEDLPYLDGMEVGFTTDTPQRLNQMLSGQIDMGIESSWVSAAKLKDEGFQVLSSNPGGGTTIAFNTTKPPFDDVRAREAVSIALNKDELNLAAYEGKAEVATSLFPKDSSLYTVDFPTQDKERAQELFDALAADGKPLTFTFSTFPTAELKVVAESVQAQLSTYKNVKTEVEVLDFTTASQIIGERRFEAATGTNQFLDPSVTLYNTLHGESRMNSAGLNDPEMNAALEAGRSADNDEDRAAAFATVQEKFNTLFPSYTYVRGYVAATANEKVGGLNQHAYGSVRPELIWLNK